MRRTFRDKTDDDEILEMLSEIADELGKDLERLEYAGKTVTVKYKVSPPPDRADPSFTPLRVSL